MTFSLSSSPSLKLTNYIYRTTLKGRLWTGCCFIFIPVIRTSFLSRHFTISKLKDTVPTNACASYNSIERVLCAVSACCTPFFPLLSFSESTIINLYMKNFLPLCFYWYLLFKGAVCLSGSLPFAKGVLLTDTISQFLASTSS